MGFSLLPKEEQYFTFFSQMTSFIYDAAHALVEMLNEKGGDYAEHLKRIKSIEHQCDDLTHSISTRLNKSFITPFDREDIYLLSGALDDIVDLIDDAARAMVMYDVHESTAHARNFAGVIERMAVQLHEVVSMLAKPNGISPRLVSVPASTAARLHVVGYWFDDADWTPPARLVNFLERAAKLKLFCADHWVPRTGEWL